MKAKQKFHYYAKLTIRHTNTAIMTCVHYVDGKLTSAERRKTSKQNVNRDRPSLRHSFEWKNANENKNSNEINNHRKTETSPITTAWGVFSRVSLASESRSKGGQNRIIARKLTNRFYSGQSRAKCVHHGYGAIFEKIYRSRFKGEYMRILRNRIRTGGCYSFDRS